MIIGNPYQFAFLLERMPEWENTWINGLMFVAVNGEIYPKEVRTTTFNSELPDILSVDSAFIDPILDKKLYSKEKTELLSYIANLTYPQSIEENNDYSFLIPFHEIGDAGYSFFILSNGEKIRILVGQWEDERLHFIDETEIGMQEYNEIKTQVIAFYREASSDPVQ